MDAHSVESPFQPPVDGRRRPVQLRTQPEMRSGAASTLLFCAFSLLFLSWPSIGIADSVSGTRRTFARFADAFPLDPLAIEPNQRTGEISARRSHERALVGDNASEAQILAKAGQQCQGGNSIFQVDCEEGLVCLKIFPEYSLNSPLPYIGVCINVSDSYGDAPPKCEYQSKKLGAGCASGFKCLPSVPQNAPSSNQSRNASNSDAQSGEANSNATGSSPQRVQGYCYPATAKSRGKQCQYGGRMGPIVCAKKLKCYVKYPPSVPDSPFVGKCIRYRIKRSSKSPPPQTIPPSQISPPATFRTNQVPISIAPATPPAQESNGKLDAFEVGVGEDCRIGGNVFQLVCSRGLFCEFKDDPEYRVGNARIGVCRASPLEGSQDSVPPPPSPPSSPSWTRAPVDRTPAIPPPVPIRGSPSPLPFRASPTPAPEAETFQIPPQVVGSGEQCRIGGNIMQLVCAQGLFCEFENQSDQNVRVGDARMGICRDPSSVPSQTPAPPAPGPSSDPTPDPSSAPSLSPSLQYVDTSGGIDGPPPVGLGESCHYGGNIFPIRCEEGLTCTPDSSEPPLIGQAVIGTCQVTKP